MIIQPSAFGQISTNGKEKGSFVITRDYIKNLPDKYCRETKQAFVLYRCM